MKKDVSKAMLFNVEDVECRAGQEIVLSQQNLNIERGENLLLLGPSGCGKTSLMNIMAGLLKPSAGDVVYDGQSYGTMSGREIDALRAEHFGFAFQKLHLIGHLSVAQNIALAQSPPDKFRVEALIDDLGLSGKAHRKTRDLSVGEAQRVAIARMVANQPDVIFADEPTSALDDVNTENVMDLLFSQAEKTGATLIVATHDARIKGRFARVLEMSL